MELGEPGAKGIGLAPLIKSIFNPLLSFEFIENGSLVPKKLSDWGNGEGNGWNADEVLFESDLVWSLEVFVTSLPSFCFGIQTCKQACSNNGSFLPERTKLTVTLCLEAVSSDYSGRRLESILAIRAPSFVASQCLLKLQDMFEFGERQLDGLIILSQNHV